MKISKTTLISLAVGIFVIVAASMGVAYLQQGKEQSLLNEELALAQQRLGKSPLQQLSSRKKELGSQLTEAEAQLQTAKAGLYQSTESIEASAALFDIAETSNVEVTAIGSLGVTTKKLKEIDLPVLPIAVTIEGDVLNLIDFIYKWTQEYPTGVVQSVEITVPEAPDEEAEAEEEEEAEEAKPSAIISVLIYNYEGD